MKGGKVAVAVLSLSTSARTFDLKVPGWLYEISLIPRGALLDSRQDTATTAATSSTASNGPDPVSTLPESAQVTQTNLNTASLLESVVQITSSGTVIDKTITTEASQTSHVTFNPQDGAGSVTFITPAATSTPLYRIGQNVTWAWNYTGILATPTAVDVLITCPTASATWTVTKNMTFAQSSYTWDTGAFQGSAVASPLLTEMYKIIIVDSRRGVSATAEAGYLAAYTGSPFGLYEGRVYTPLSSWVCATCSAAMSDMERRAIGAVVIMSAVTVLSFTWFVAGFGALF